MNFWTTLKKPIIALAPMEGVTDGPFRRICRRQQADVVYTEFVAADAIAVGAPSLMRKLERTEEERPVVAQIFGHNPASFAIAAKKISALGYDGLDINFGCPARKVVGSGSGVALLRDPQFARQLVEAALSATSIPVSIKVRTSIRRERVSIRPDDDTRVTALDLVHAIQDLPVAAIMVHGRAAEAGHDGQVDVVMIRQVKAEFSGLVLANGGIRHATDVPTMLAATGADGVGIARGAWGAPWIFAESHALLADGQASPTPWADRRQVILQHAELVWAADGEHGLRELRKHLVRYVSDFPGAAAIRRQAVHVSTVDDVRRVVEQLPVI